MTEESRSSVTIGKIITHPGGAHKDEFLACAILVAKFGVPIERRNPTEEELDDPTVAVVDIGFRHEAERHNFDHHQFPSDSVPTCSLSLVFQWLGIYEEAQKYYEWLEVLEWFDCRGPYVTAARYRIDRDLVGRLSSPIDAAFLRRFARTNRLDVGDPLWESMRIIGEEMVGYLDDLRERFGWIKEHSKAWEFQGFNALFLPRADPMPVDLRFAVSLYLKEKGIADQFSALIYPDRRSSGYGLVRLSDERRIDFHLIEREPDVHFVHRQGFIAKTTATEERRLRNLMAKSWTSTRCGLR